jgi:hypothetical protein
MPWKISIVSPGMFAVCSCWFILMLALSNGPGPNLVPNVPKIDGSVWFNLVDGGLFLSHGTAMVENKTHVHIINYHLPE